MNEKKFIIPKNYFYDLIVKDNDVDYVEISKEFLECLEKEYKYFTKNFNDEEKKNDTFLEETKKLGKYFYPEVLLRKSPITLINAPWGSGKTYFIESLIKNFISKKMKSSFKKIVVIDVWKYSNSNNIVEDIMGELFRILSTRSKKTSMKFKKDFSLFFNNFLLNPLKNRTGIDVTEMINHFTEYSREQESVFLKKSLSFPKTIIFFDNIERLGNDSWNIIKSIVRLSRFDNFVILLSMNVEKLFNNDQDGNNEFPIEKFIDIKYFEFKSNYSSLLTEAKFNKEEIKFLNNALNESNDGRVLSMREIKQRFVSNNIFNIKDRYLKLQDFFKFIWSSSEEIENYIFSIVKNYASNLEKLQEIFNELNIKEWYFLDYNFMTNLEKIFNNKKNDKSFLQLFEDVLINEFGNDYKINLSDDYIKKCDKKILEVVEKIDKNLFNFSHMIYKELNILSLKDFVIKICMTILNKSPKYIAEKIYPESNIWKIYEKYDDAESHIETIQEKYDREETLYKNRKYVFPALGLKNVKETIQIIDSEITIEKDDDIFSLMNELF